MRRRRDARSGRFFIEKFIEDFVENFEFESEEAAALAQLLSADQRHASSIRIPLKRAVLVPL